MRKRFKKIFYGGYIRQLLHEKIITESDLSNPEFVYEQIHIYLTKNAKTIGTNISISHRENLILVAEKEYDNGSEELGTALYSTCVEHTLNRIILISCISKNFDQKTTNDIIKNVNIIGKCTWLLKLLELPNFNSNHVKTILKIADERNAYFHYKWKPTEDTKNHDLEQLKKIKLLIKYLKSYETKLEYNGRKKLIDELSANYR